MFFVHTYVPFVHTPFANQLCGMSGLIVSVCVCLLCAVSPVVTDAMQIQPVSEGVQVVMVCGVRTENNDIIWTHRKRVVGSSNSTSESQCFEILSSIMNP